MFFPFSICILHTSIENAFLHLEVSQYRLVFSGVSGLLWCFCQFKPFRQLHVKAHCFCHSITLWIKKPKISYLSWFLSQAFSDLVSRPLLIPIKLLCNSLPGRAENPPHTDPPCSNEQEIQRMWSTALPSAPPCPWHLPWFPSSWMALQHLFQETLRLHWIRNPAALPLPAKT